MGRDTSNGRVELAVFSIFENLCALMTFLFPHRRSFLWCLTLVGTLFPGQSVAQIVGVTPHIASVLNAASYAGGAVSPGEIVAIFGSGIGPAILASAKISPDGRLDSLVSETRVLFDGIAAPLLYASAGQTGAIVPYAVTGRGSTLVEVEYKGNKSNSVIVSVASSAPGIFTISGSGTGQGAALNQDGSTNSASNPALRGSVAVLYATGEGQTLPAGEDGLIMTGSLSAPILPVTATVGEITADVLYAGSAPGLVAGALQANIRIPANAIPGTAVPVQIAVGNVVSQSGVTVAIGAPTVVTLERVSAPFLTLATGEAIDITIALNRPPGPGGANIVVKSNDPILPVPPAVTIGAGSYKTNITLHAAPVASARNVEITVIYGGTTKFLDLTVSPVHVPVVLGAANLSVKVRTGGEFPVPEAAAAYLGRLIGDIFDPVYGNLHGVCGASAGPRDVEVVYDPDFIHPGGSNDDPEAPLVLRSLPRPDASGVDWLSFDGPFIHEVAHELRRATWNKLFETFKYDPRGPYAEEEGFANACESLVNQRLSTTGRRKAGANGADKTLLFDNLLRLGGDLLSAPTIGGVSAFSAYSYPLVSAGEGAYDILASRSGSPGGASLAPLEINYFAALTKKQAPLTPSDRSTFLNALGFTIDGVQPGVWLEKMQIMTLDPADTESPGLKLAVVSFPLNPNDVYVQVIKVDADALGSLHWSPIKSGPVTIRILDTRGIDVRTPIQTDLAVASDPNSPVQLALPGTLGNGAYTIVASVLIDGTRLEQRIPVARVPVVGFPDNFAGLFAVAADDAGNVYDVPFSVSGGSIFWQGPGAVIAASQSVGPSVLTINNKTIAYPKPLSRFVAVPVANR
jgi:uncharacterized protein (TIGR03437 family)